MKTLIAVPCMDMCHSRFAQSLAMLEKVGDCQVSFILNSLIYDARNKFCEQAIQGEFDYIFWLDSDMIFPSYVLRQMLQDDKDIVSGLYFRRNYPYTPVAFEELWHDEEDSLHKKDLLEWPNELFRVGGVGFGCVLMKTDVLFDIAGKDGGVWFNPMPDAGEDAAFCLRAQEHGYEIWIDPTFKLGHVGQTVITEGIYKGSLKG